MTQRGERALRVHDPQREAGPTACREFDAALTRCDGGAPLPVGPVVCKRRDADWPAPVAQHVDRHAVAREGERAPDGRAERYTWTAHTRKIRLRVMWHGYGLCCAGPDVQDAHGRAREELREPAAVIAERAVYFDRRRDVVRAQLLAVERRKDREAILSQGPELRAVSGASHASG